MALLKHSVLAAALCFSLSAQAEASPVDPTQPLSYSPSPAAVINSNLHLESILYSSSRKVVVINQTVLGQGDQLGNIEVTRINPDSVEIREIKQDGKSRTLALPKTRVKTAPTNNNQDY